jgi:beta-lactamase class A
MKPLSKFTSLIFFFIWILTIPAFSQADLRQSIMQLVGPLEAEIGIGVKHLERGDTLSVYGDGHFPMQSVFKFHLALAVLQAVDEGKLSLDEQVLIQRADYIPNTWSPIAAKYPEANVDVSIRDLISYTVASSDNNACDVLFRLVGGPEKVDEYIRDLGIKGIAIANTEREMHKSWDLQFNNWTTPRDMAELLHLFYKGRLLSPSATAFLKSILEGTITGKNRIKGLLPEGTILAHKTGTGANDSGLIGAVNDVGVVTLPDGGHVAIALFITKTSEPVTALERVMAEISKKVFDYYSSGQH